MIIRYGEDGMRLDKKGFSLIEIMVAIAIMSVLSIAMMKTYTGCTRVYTTQEVVAGVQQDLRAALNIMTQDIRMAGFDPQDADLFAIEEATANKIRFTSDTDMNGNLEPPPASVFEEITYEWRADLTLYQTLYETIGNASTQTLVENVTNLTFTYLDGNNLPTATLANIRTVTILMTIQEITRGSGTVNRTLSTRVQCRNLGY